MGDPHLSAQTDKIVVLITVPTEEDAGKIARHLVEKRLAACVNIVPGIRSIYTWEGEVCDEGEFLLVVKSRTDLFARVAEAVSGRHPYSVPEIIALPIVSGSEPYLDWIGQVTARVGEG